MINPDASSVGCYTYDCNDNKKVHSYVTVCLWWSIFSEFDYMVVRYANLDQILVMPICLRLSKKEMEPPVFTDHMVAQTRRIVSMTTMADVDRYANVGYSQGHRVGSFIEFSIITEYLQASFTDPVSTS